MSSHATNTLKRLIVSSFYLDAFIGKKISKRVKKARKHSKGELGGLCHEEFVDIGKSRRTTKEKLDCTLFGDDEGMQLAALKYFHFF
ncbi:unnamed protein product [Prunus armeniaca]|uniref:Uncharacterized protein n=1 Tax=Prunus armeniaca TaxID=36596 RepID=A0A6J5VDB4_PRUAR|nr:unnamed protein product [Prunus armeniaca]